MDASGVLGYSDGVGKFALDSKFPYDSPVSVNTTLVSDDTPCTRLDPGFDKYKKNLMNFQTYLIYKPKGAEESTIWVTLSLIEWGWYGTAEYLNNEWKLTSGNTITCGDWGTPTSVLPE